MPEILGQLSRDRHVAKWLRKNMGGAVFSTEAFKEAYPVPKDKAVGGVKEGDFWFYMAKSLTRLCYVCKGADGIVRLTFKDSVDLKDSM